MNMSSRSVAFPLVVVLAVACGTGAIVATYSRLSHTWDEGIHLAAGLELLQEGHYGHQTENPPLARVVNAIIPYVRGARLPPRDQRRPTVEMAVDAAFYRTPDYIRHVTEGRLATLLFFWATVACTWVLAGGRSDPWVAVLASAAVATLPPIVAHSGFATTDVAFVAAFLLVLVALRRCLRTPSTFSAALTGAALGVAVATKFTTLVFLPPAAVAILALHAWPDRRAHLAALARPALWRRVVVLGIVALATIWLCYGFRVGRLADLNDAFVPFGRMPTTGWPAFVRDWTLPAHEFVHGLLYLKAHTEYGQPVTMLGQFSARGFWFYYPVVFAIKTPGPFLLFAGVGLVGLLRYRSGRDWHWAAGLGLAALGILLVSLASPINLGVRHVLVIYPLVALASAYGLVRLAEESRRPATVLAAGAACVGLQAALLWAIVPNQIAYFNMLAGRDPAWVSSGSNFDWGQGAVALERYFAERPVPELYILLSGTIRPCRMKLPPLKSLPDHPVTGWIAISDAPYRANGGSVREEPCGVGDSPGPRRRVANNWLDWLKTHEPVAILEKTVRVYHITDLPPQTAR
ncbi:MAG: glycosyltransferase family 39 protein [Vicinamibacterales bacterium]